MTVRPRVPTASTATVTARDIGSLPIRSAEDALRLAPGLVLVQHGAECKGQQYFLRGFDAIHGSDLELTLEGIPLNEWSNIHAQGYLDLCFLVPETIETVEVTKGPFALDQGAFAMAGSADFRLGIPVESRGARLAYTGGTTNRHRGLLTYTPREGDGEDFLALEGLYDEGFGENRSVWRGNLMGRHRLLDSERRGTLSLLALGHYADFELPGTLRYDDVQAGRVGFYDAYDHAGHGQSARGLLALRYGFRNQAHAVTAQVHGGYRQLDLLENFTGFLYDREHGDRRGQRQRGWSYGASFEHDVQLHDTVMLRTGFGSRGDLLGQRQRHVDQQLAPLAVERSLEVLQTLSHVFSGLRLQPTPSLRISVGARFDVAWLSTRDRTRDGARGDGLLWALSPRTVVEWRPHLDWRLFASYGRGFRPPEARAFSSFDPERMGIADDVYTGGEPRMAYADALEIGVRWYPSHHADVRLSGFGTWIASESIFDHVSGVSLELNATRRLGSELELRVYPTEWLLLVGDATFVDARFVESKNPVPNAPWLSGSLRLVLTHPSGVRAGLRLFALAPRTLPLEATGSAWGELDASVGYDWRWLRVGLELENLLNRRIREGEYNYASYWFRDAPPSDLPALHFVPGAPFNARLTLAVIF